MGEPVELPNLPETARAYLRRHLREAVEAARAAIEDAARRETREKVPEALGPFVDHVPEDDEIIGPSETARRHGVSRQTLYNRADKGRLLAWRRNSR